MVLRPFKSLLPYGLLWQGSRFSKVESYLMALLVHVKFPLGQLGFL